MIEAKSCNFIVEAKFSRFFPQIKALPADCLVSGVSRGCRNQYLMEMRFAMREGEAVSRVLRGATLRAEDAT